MLMRALLPLRMRPRVQRAPGIPCALWFMEGQAYGKNSGDLRRGNANGRSRRQRVFDQLDPVRGTEHDRLVVEIIGGMMQSGAVAVAAEDEGAGPCFQHV